MIKRASTWVTGAVLALTFMAGGAVAANAEITGSGGLVTMYMPGTKGATFETRLNNDTFEPVTANLAMTWRAEKYATFSDTTVHVQEDSFYDPELMEWVYPQTPVTGCTISDDATTLTCPPRPLTIPASQPGFRETGYGWGSQTFVVKVDYSPDTPPGRRVFIHATWTSDDQSQISDGTARSENLFRGADPRLTHAWDEDIGRTVQPGATELLTAKLANTPDTDAAANLAFTWQAGEFSTFSSSKVTYRQSHRWDPDYDPAETTLTGCTLSNNNKALTCPPQHIALPLFISAILTTEVVISPDTPPETQVDHYVTWTSDDLNEFTEGTLSLIRKAAPPTPPVGSNPQGGTRRYQPGTTGDAITALFNGSDPVTANLALTWQADKYATFPDATVGYYSVGTQEEGTLTGCTLSEGDTKLTCPPQPVTIPQGTFVFSTDLNFSPDAPPEETSTIRLTWVSDDQSQVVDGLLDVTYTFPPVNVSPVPLIDLRVGLPIAAVLATAGALTTRRRWKKPSWDWRSQQ